MPTPAKTKKIVIVAGETSGDIHGALLAKSIKDLNPAIKLFGMGGEKMQEAGVEIFFKSPKLAVTGFIEVLQHLTKFKQLFRLVVGKLAEIKPDAVILIDYPGFNLRLAKEVKVRGIKLFYYISPQVWAWGKSRIKTIQQFINTMLVIFKFEEDFYKKENINAVFVGHPLLDMAVGYKSSHCEKDRIKIALLPGSRENEVKYILPVMLETSLILQEKIPGAEFMLASVDSVKKETYQKIISRYPVKNLVLYDNKSYDCLWVCDFALVCSGTATLETAIFGKPMAIIYKMSLLSYLIIKNLIRVPYIGMANLVSGKKIVPEFIQFQARPKTIADYTLKILNDSPSREKIETGLAEVRKKLGEPGAARRAAEVILREMGE